MSRSINAQLRAGLNCRRTCQIMWASTPTRRIAGSPQQRQFASSCTYFAEQTTTSQSPIERYSALVEKGTLREDSHQREIIQKLERLHNELISYKQNLQSESETHAKAGGGFGLVSFGRSRQDNLS